MSFAEIQEQALSEWQALQHSDKTRILVGTASCGRTAGAIAVLEAIKRELSRLNIEAIVTQVGCIGLCYAEPLVDIIKPNQPGICYGNVTPEIIPELIEDYIINDNPRPDLALGSIGEGSVAGIAKLEELPVLKSQVRALLVRCGQVDPTDIKQYIANGGYSGFAKALEMTPEAVIEEIKNSGLRGRGGAGFPTGQKWEFCQRAPGKEKYLICNADEGDPGTFVDRTLMEGDPQAIVEGMLIAAYAMGTTGGYIYIRIEYPLAAERLKIAIEQAREQNLLGNNILGSGFNFEIEIRQGAGAFVCGEETALIDSIEGKRGIPRLRPPFPAQKGLWAKPTNVNNVETLANVPLIIREGSSWYASLGTEKSKGTKLFSLSGDIARPGVVEVPFGITLRTLVEEIGGGVVNGRSLKIIQPGGATGGIIPPGLMERSIDFESLAEIGSCVGSGSLAVISESACLVDLNRFFLAFCKEESCGKCVPCRIGTRQMLNILERITRGEGEPGDIEHLEQLARLVSTVSLCGLGQTAPNPVITTLRHFREEYEEHIEKGYCQAGVCNIGSALATVGFGIMLGR